MGRAGFRCRARDAAGFEEAKGVAQCFPVRRVPEVRRLINVNSIWSRAKSAPRCSFGRARDAACGPCAETIWKAILGVNPASNQTQTLPRSWDARGMLLLHASTNSQFSTLVRAHGCVMTCDAAPAAVRELSFRPNRTVKVGLWHCAGVPSPEE